MTKPNVDVKLWPDLTDAEKLERWEQVEQVMLNMPEHERTQHFDMGTWGTHTDCGTVACVAGHCGLNPGFIAQGFELVSQVIPGYFNGGGYVLEHITLDFSIQPEDFFGTRGDMKVFTQIGNPKPLSAVTFDEALGSVRKYILELRTGERQEFP